MHNGIHDSVISLYTVYVCGAGDVCWISRAQKSVRGGSTVVSAHYDNSLGGQG